MIDIYGKIIPQHHKKNTELILYLRNMYMKKTEGIRQQLIIKYLKSHSKVTLDSLMSDVNAEFLADYAGSGSKKGFAKSSFEKSLHRLRHDRGFEIEHFKEGSTHYYRLLKAHHTPFLDDDEKEEMAFLMALMKMYKGLSSVSWLEEILVNEYQVDAKYFDRNKHFVMVHPEITNHDKLLELARKIMVCIEREELILFTYRRVNDEFEEHVKEVAPLQVRYYEGRYYLIGCETYNSDKKKEHESPQFKSHFSVYALDQFIDYAVKQGIDEDTEEIVHFNYKALFKQTELATIFNDTIGIIVENKPVQVFRIRFKNWAKSYVLNKPLHHSQRIINEKTDEVVVEIKVRPGVELDFQLSRFREYYEIL
jgi:hypothetical protein